MDAGIDFGRSSPDALSENIRKLSPAALAFNGKKAAKQALGLKTVEFGAHADRIGGTRVFVLPSTSGAASGHWDIGHWHALAALV